jgi:hypothetical protein
MSRIKVSPSVSLSRCRLGVRRRSPYTHFYTKADESTMQSKDCTDFQDIDNSHCHKLAYVNILLT